MDETNGVLSASESRVIDKRGRLAALTTTVPVVLELGCGNRKRHPEAIGIDLLDHEAVDVVGDVFAVLERIPDGIVDAVYCYHLVEHLMDLPKFVRALRRVICVGGTVLIVAPHFSNPYFYSDYTHRTAFGLYSFSYLAGERLFRRRVPRYLPDTGFELSRVKLVFKAARPFYVAHAWRRLVQVIVNLTAYSQEVYERSFVYLVPCYEVEYRLVKRG